jgi:hypothetical protein
MDRRESPGILGTTIVGLVAGSPGRAQAVPGQPGHNDKAHDECLKACNSCADQCAATFHHCVREVASGKKEHAGALRFVADCEGFCRFSASIVARQSPFMAYACSACANICRDCAGECDKFDAPTMKDCAKACRACETSCRTMVKAMGAHDRPDRRYHYSHASALKLPAAIEGQTNIRKGDIMRLIQRTGV